MKRHRVHGVSDNELCIIAVFIVGLNPFLSWVVLIQPWLLYGTYDIVATRKTTFNVS